MNHTHSQHGGEAASVELADRTPLITTTDLQGTISFANTAFVRTCGFAMEQVLGASHNIVRHPDMPPKVFADMWAALNAGRPWTGLVKNRSSSGAAYWVKANIIPMFKDHRTVGFTSVQSRADESEARRAEQVYRLWQAGDGAQYVLRSGRIVETGWRALIKAVKNPLDLPVQWRMQGTAAILGALFCAVLACALAPAAAAGLMNAAGGWRVWALVGGSVGLAASTAVALYFLSRVVAPLKRSLETAMAIAGGEITRQFDDTRTAGELLDLNLALGQMVAKMAAVLGDSRDHAAEVASVVDGLAEGARRLAERSAGQAGDVQAVTRSTADIDVLSQRNTDAAGQASRSAHQASEEADAACTAAGAMHTAMHDIAVCSRRIGEISHVIDEISLQTGILALNAAAAASRAGEQGRTFNIIAGEVRTLAQRSGAAAKEIKLLVGESQQQTSAGEKLASQVGARINGVAQQVKEVSAMISQISLAAQEQCAGVEHINVRLQTLDAATRQNAELARESASSSSDAIREARRLQAALGVWSLE
ncbi:methyl-accepting chemotaxis protein [Methylibium sp.]|uniref:methyl-accepting chemotaxis protein n=1 Tax=Methylibium sp. TaxID=2067992 RepID=UPI003D13004B